MSVSLPSSLCKALQHKYDGCGTQQSGKPTCGSQVGQSAEQAGLAPSTILHSDGLQRPSLQNKSQCSVPSSDLVVSLQALYVCDRRHSYKPLT